MDELSGAQPPDRPDQAERPDARERAVPDAREPAGSREARPLAEPRSRAEVAAEARAAVVRPDERRSPDGGGTVARTPAGGEDRGRPGGEIRQEHADGHHGPRYQVRAVEADRTLGDTTPTGIGLKPDGDQLRELESDRLARADRFRRNVYERVDDIQDVTEKTAGTLQGLLDAHRPTGHDVTYTAQPAYEASAPPPADAGSLATAGLALGLLADRAIGWARDHYRRPEGSTP
jgi:hypothetical protein